MTSGTSNKHGFKCPSDVAVQGSIPDNDSQAAGTKNHDGSPPPKKSRKSPPPSKGAPKYITQETDVPEEASETAAGTYKLSAVLTPVGTVSAGVQAVPRRATMEVPAANPKANLDQRKPPPTYTKVPYANTEFAKAFSSYVSMYFTQLMTKPYIVSKIIQSEPMPNFRKKLSTKSPTKKKKKKKKESLLSMVCPIPCQIDKMDYEMKSKWDNFQSLLQHVHGEREVGDTKPCLHGCNVVNYVTIKKYLVVYQEILVWYMENVKYPPAPEKIDQGLYFYTKCDNGSSHNSQDYDAVMKQFLDDLIAKSSLGASTSQSYNQTTLDNNYFKSKRVECLEFLINNGKEVFPQNESKDYVPNKLMKIFYQTKNCILSGNLVPQSVKRGFHHGGNMPSTDQAFLPIHLPSVFHFVLHYKDLVTNLYHIHVDFDTNIVTLLPSKIGEGKICLAPATVTEGIIYLVKEWLIRRMNIALVGLFDNSWKAIIQKVLKLPHTRSFGFQDVMQTIEDLVLKERRYLAQSQFEDKEYIN
eukprot:jgi/Psemu1/29850/gm1.29850_g